MQIELNDKMSALLNLVKEKSGSKNNSEAIEYAIHIASAKFFFDALEGLQGSGRGGLSE